MLLRFLADSLDYSHFIRGIDRLTPDQQQVLYERLSHDIEKLPKIEKTAEIISNEVETVRIAPRTTTDKPMSNIECCVHCGSVAIKKHGKTRGGVQRYICKDCGKTFSENYGLITHYSHLSEWQWMEVVRGLVEQLSLTAIAKNTGVSVGTAWLCRVKIYTMLKDIYGYCDTFNSIVEADGTYTRVSFKGKRDKDFFIDTLGRLPRHHRNKEQRIEYIESAGKYEKLFRENPKILKEMICGSQKRLLGRSKVDVGHQHVCILTAIDRSNNIYIEPVTAGSAKATDVYEKLHSRINQEAVLITDEHNSYKYLCRTENIEHITIKGGTYTKGTYNLARVNRLHSSLKKSLCGCATKHLDTYLLMFWWLEKNKDHSTSELTTKLFNIATGCISNATRSKLNRITRQSLLAKALPIDTKGFY